MSTRVFALIAFVVAIILFAVGALQSTATAATNGSHYLFWGLVATVAGFALWVLEPYIGNPRQP